jgi:hypothetical protein
MLHRKKGGRGVGGGVSDLCLKVASVHGAKLSLLSLGRLHRSPFLQLGVVQRVLPVLVLVALVLVLAMVLVLVRGGAASEVIEVRG